MITDQLIMMIPVVSVLTFLAGLVWKLWPLVQKISHVVDDFLGSPAREGVDERPGVMRRLSHIEKYLEEHAQACPHEIPVRRRKW